MFHGGATFKSPRSRDPGSILPSGAVWVEFARSPLRPHGFPPALQRLAGPQFNCPTPVPSPLHRLQQGSLCVSCSGLRLYRRWDPPPLCYQRGCPTKWEGNIPPQDRTRSPRESDAAITTLQNAGVAQQDRQHSFYPEMLPVPPRYSSILCLIVDVNQHLQFPSPTPIALLRILRVGCK